MNLLLDTHIWVWSVAAPQKLSRRVGSALESASNELWVSPASVWELLVLIEKRRLAISGNPLRWIKEGFRALALREAPLTVDVAIRSRLIKVDHQDPVDRFLAATAKVYDLTLVTADERLIRSSGFLVLANT